MAELLTTRQLQEILQVDRTTIYRMADQGRIPAIKVGNQWRFPRQQIEAWLQSQSSTVAPTPPAEPGQPVSTSAAGSRTNLAQLLPLDCVQLIQDSFAEVLGVMILIVDLEGNMITEPSNPCGLFLATEQSPSARERCVELWNEMAQLPAIMPRFQESHLGLLCARGYVRVRNEITGMLILGGITPPIWPPSPSRLQEIADFLQVDTAFLQEHIHEVHQISLSEQKRILPYVQRIADIVSHIATERAELYDRLQRIAQITQIVP